VIPIRAEAGLQPVREQTTEATCLRRCRERCPERNHAALKSQIFVEQSRNGERDTRAVESFHERLDAPRAMEVRIAVDEQEHIAVDQPCCSEVASTAVADVLGQSNNTARKLFLNSFRAPVAGSVVHDHEVAQFDAVRDQGPSCADG
jgi:hypothetical protein